MGLWDILTKDIKLGSHELSWSEPTQFRARLRGDFIWRMAISLSAWLAATGILLVIFSFNQDPPSRSVALGLGAVFGMGPVTMFLFFRKNQVSGNIKLFRDRLERHKLSSGYLWRWMQTTTWGLGGVTRFHIVTRDKTGTSFHVMFFKSGGEWELIGIPARIDLKQLRSALSAGGAEVKPANRVPDTFCRPLSPTLTGVSGVVGIALAVIGFATFNPGNAQNLPQRPDIAQQKLDFPQPDFDNPGPIDPNLPGPGPVPGPGPDFHQNPDGPLPSTAIDDESIGIRSQLVGGTGGVPGTRVSAEQKPVLGVQYRLNPWAGRDRVAMLNPVYEPADNNLNQNVIMAKPGYALGAVEVNAPQFVDGVRLVFMKLTADGTVDPNDRDDSDWIGAGSADPVRLERDGKPIVGFHSRDGAVLDAVGVVFRE